MEMLDLSVKNTRTKDGDEIMKSRIPQFIVGDRGCRSLAALLLVAATSTGALAHDNDRKDPIVLEKSGGFIIGGYHKHITPTTPPQADYTTLSCDHGYVEYFMPQDPRKTSIVLWHSSSAQVWQNRWDGGEGFKDKMLRADYPTYIWDGPRVGRANWGCESITYTPSNRDQGNFSAWTFGPTLTKTVPTPSDFFPGTQFPANSPKLEEYWWNATGARYDEFDFGRNINIETDAAAIAADSGRLGNQIYYLTNSAGGLRAMVTTSKTTGNNIAGMTTYESIGYVFPLTVTEPAAVGLPKPATLCNMSGAACAFGPIGIPEEDFKKLAKLKKIQFLWGDNRPENGFVTQSRQCAALINAYGGHAEVVKLAEDEGLIGSTHIAFMDMDNDKVANLLFKNLKKAKLDGYQHSKPWGHWRWEN
jgi:hypothetical protein